MDGVGRADCHALAALRAHAAVQAVTGGGASLGFGQRRLNFREVAQGAGLDRAAGLAMAAVQLLSGQNLRLVDERQQIVLAGVIEGPEGMKLAMSVRLWRNASSSRGEIETELTRALNGVEEGSTT